MTSSAASRKQPANVRRLRWVCSGARCSTPRSGSRFCAANHDRAQQLLAGPLDESGWYARGHGTSLATLTTRIDAPAVLGHTERVEHEAPQLLQPGTYVEPFALRALGMARREPTLIQQAIDRFNLLDLPWHSAQTRAMK